MEAAIHAPAAIALPVALAERTQVMLVLAFAILALALGATGMATAGAVAPRGTLRKIILALITVFCQLRVTTQILSLFSALKPWPFLVANLLVTCIALTLLRTTRKADRHPGWVTSVTRSWGDVRRTLDRSWWLKILALAFVGQLVALAVFAYLAAPPHVDTYHFETPCYWAQNGSMRPFVTHNLRQTVLPTGMENLVLPLALFLKSVRLAFVFEWIAFALLPFVIAALGRRLGLNRESALFAGLLSTGFTVCLRAPFLGKNDLLAAVAALSAFLFLLDVRPRRRHRGRNLQFLAISVLCICVAGAVKLSTLAALPALVLLAVRILKRELIRRDTMRWLGTAALLGWLVTGLCWYQVQNAVWLGDAPEAKAFIARVRGQPHVRAVWARCVRGTVQLLDPTYLPEAWDRRWTDACNAIVGHLGAANPVPGEQGYYVYIPSQTRLRLGLGPVGFLLLVPLTAAGLMAVIRRDHRPVVVPIRILAPVGVLTFVVTHAMLNWQTHGLTRLSLVAFLLASPLLGLLYSRVPLACATVLLHLGNTAAIVTLILLTCLHVNGVDTGTAPIVRHIPARNRSKPRLRIVVRNGETTQTRERYCQNPSSLRDLYQELQRWKGAQPVSVGVYGGGILEEHYLFGPNLQNRVFPLLDARKQDSLCLPTDKLDLIVFVKPKGDVIPRDVMDRIGVQPTRSFEASYPDLPKLMVVAFDLRDAQDIPVPPSPSPAQ